jgi:cysteine desulfurase
MRAGTENLPAVLAMVAALRLREQSLSVASPTQKSADRDAFESALAARLPALEVVDADTSRLWNTSLLLLPEFRNTQWLARLSDRGFCVSTGSACSSGQGASEILAARGIAPERLGRILRCSGSWHHTEADWQALADAIASVWQDLQQKQETRSKGATLPLFTSKD